MRFAFRLFSYVLWATCTLLLLVPDPRLLFDPRDAGEAVRGYEHLLMFSVLTIILLLAHPKRSMRMWACVLIVYGVLTEVLQIVIPYRTFQGIDILEDTLGVLIGLGTCVLLTGLPRAP